MKVVVVDVRQQHVADVLQPQAEPPQVSGGPARGQAGIDQHVPGVVAGPQRQHGAVAGGSASQHTEGQGHGDSLWG